MQQGRIRDDTLFDRNGTGLAIFSLLKIRQGMPAGRVATADVSRGFPWWLSDAPERDPRLGGWLSDAGETAPPEFFCLVCLRYTTEFNTLMRNLTTYFKSPFDDPDISVAELSAFSTDFQARMIGNNPGGVLSPLIAALAEPLATLDEASDDDAVKLGQRKARKFAKQQFRDSLAAEAGWGELRTLRDLRVRPVGLGLIDFIPRSPYRRMAIPGCAIDNRSKAPRLRALFPSET